MMTLTFSSIFLEPNERRGFLMVDCNFFFFRVSIEGITLGFWLVATSRSHDVIESGNPDHPDHLHFGGLTKGQAKGSLNRKNRYVT